MSRYSLLGPSLGLGQKCPLNYTNHFKLPRQLMWLIDQNGEHGFFASGVAHSEVEGDDPLGESRRIACKRCGNFHLWVLTKKTKSQARWCQAFIIPPSISFINHHLLTKDSIQLITTVPDFDLSNGKMMLILNLWAFCLKDCKDIHQAKDGDGWVKQYSQPIFFGLLQKVCAIVRMFFVNKHYRKFTCIMWYI